VLAPKPCFEARLRLPPFAGSILINPVSLQGLDVTPQRRAIHHHVLGKRIDRERTLPLELRQNRELGDAQADRRQELIIELGYVARGGADGEAVAIVGSWQCYGRHLVIS
jgi:hypothetical protein